MAFFKKSADSKLAQLENRLAADDQIDIAERAKFPEVWENDRIIEEARDAVRKAPTSENIRHLTRLLAESSSAQTAILPLLINHAEEKRTQRRLALRPLAHSAADEVAAGLKKRRAEVVADDERKSDELSKAIVSHEVLSEIDRRLRYVESGRNRLDAGEVTHAVADIRQAAS